MSTRSFIGMEVDGKIEAIYCHWDGYPTHHFDILTKHYKSVDKIKTLLNLGHLSILAPAIGAKHDFNIRSSTNDHCFHEWCCAYGRDRGEKDTEKKIFDNEADFIKSANGSNAEYVYLFKNGQWNWKPIDGKNWRKGISKKMAA